MKKIPEKIKDIEDLLTNIEKEIQEYVNKVNQLNYQKTLLLGEKIGLQKLQKEIEQEK